MNTTEVDRGAARTSTRIIVYAGAIGLLAAFYTGGMAMGGSFAREGYRVALKRGLISGITFGSLGVALAGLCGLLAGAKPGRGFSYPFALSLGAFGAVVQLSLTPQYYPGPVVRTGLIWFTWIVVSVIAGTVLTMCIREYGQRSRTGARIGAAAMFLIGAFLIVLMSPMIGGDRRALIFLVGTLSFAVCGGCLGAVIGAIGGGGAAKCWRNDASPPGGWGAGQGSTGSVMFGCIRGEFYKSDSD